MMTRQEGYGCSSSKLGSFTWPTKGMKVNYLHSSHGDSVGENLSPRSVLEHRALSGLAIAINLEEEKSKPSHTQDHLVLNRYCCKRNTHHEGARQEGNSQHSLILGSSFSRERLTLTQTIHKKRETNTDTPIVGLRMVASLYPMLHVSNPEAKRHENLVLGRSVSRERMYMEVTRYEERQKLVCPGMNSDEQRKQSDACEGVMKGSISSSPPSQNGKTRQPAPDRKSKGSREYGGQQRERFLAGASAEDSIFYYVNPSSSDISHMMINDLRVESFLKSCAFCKCHLGVGKDIYMYRGDQAFCSAECRYQQIMIDECMDLATC